MSSTTTTKARPSCMIYSLWLANKHLHADYTYSMYQSCSSVLRENLNYHARACNVYAAATLKRTSLLPLCPSNPPTWSTEAKAHQK